MKVFISADIEGVNNILTWDETSLNSAEYGYYDIEDDGVIDVVLIFAHKNYVWFSEYFVYIFSVSQTSTPKLFS